LYGRVVGLDIGSYSLKAVVGRGGFGRFEVHRFIEEPLGAMAEPEPPREERGEKGDGALSRAIASFLAANALGDAEIVCALPGHLASTRRLTLPFTDPRKVQRTLPFEVEAQIPYGIEEILLDYQVIETAPSRTEILVGLARRELIAKHLETLEAGGVDPRILELDATALANAASFLGAGSGFLFLVDVGHAKTCLCALREGNLHSVRTIPIGGRSFTSALGEDLRVDAAEGERRKHAAGLDLMGARTPAFSRAIDRLVNEIDRTLTAPENVRVGRAERIVLFGGSARMRGLRELLAERLNVTVDAPKLPNDPRFLWRPGPDDATVLPAALGLALRGMTRSPVSRLNLRREEFVYRRDFQVLRRRFLPTLAIAGALFLLILVNVVTIIMKNRHDIAQLDRRIEAIFHETHPGVTRVVDPTAQMKAGLRDMERRAQALGLYGGNITALDVLKEISTRVPRDVDVTVSDLSIDEDRIRIHGTTGSFELVDKLKEDLQKVPFFTEVNVAEVKSDRGGGKSFNLTITVGAPTTPAQAPASGPAAPVPRGGA
jgi:general secretion pathway protein L